MRDCFKCGRSTELDCVGNVVCLWCNPQLLPDMLDSLASDTERVLQEGGLTDPMSAIRRALDNQQYIMRALAELMRREKKTEEP